MQPEMTESTDVFDADGHLAQTGWAKHLLLNYNRDQSRASRLRIKEWDCYVITNPAVSLSLIIADVGYFGMATVEWIDFAAEKAHGDISLKLFTKGRLNLPPTADAGVSEFPTKKEKRMKFVVEATPEGGRARHLAFEFPKFKWQGARGIKGEVTLTEAPGADTMVNLVPFENPKHFVYVQKIVCMAARGWVEVGGERHEFHGRDNRSWGALDWSRGVFPYRTTWWWAYASGILNDKPFGFNVDYGFGTESSKSMLFYDGVGHHLDEVTYTWNEKDLLQPWVFTSNDDRVNLELVPVLKQKMHLPALVLSTKGVHVYGYVTGTVVLDDGTELALREEDKVFASAEHFHHRW